MTALAAARRVRVLRITVAALAAMFALAPRASAQQRDSASSAVTRRPPARADSVVRPPLSPRRAFFTSFLVPGLAQVRLDRYKVGAIFAAAELGSIGMAVKSRRDLRIARRHAGDTAIVAIQPDTVETIPSTAACPKGTNGLELGPVDSVAHTRPVICPSRYTPDRIRARRTHYEDWIAMIVFNHLFAGADGFVAAQLWDLPTHVSLRPDGRGAILIATVAW